jgi:hypothetical protein
MNRFFIKSVFVSALFLLSYNIFSQTSDKGVISKSDSLHNDSASKHNNKPFSLKTGLPAQISGYTQIRYQDFQQSGSNSGFDIYHARFNVMGKVTSHWDYRVQYEFAGKGAPKLIDAYGEYHFSNYLNFTAGQFYIPLSMENMITDEYLESVYRSQVVNALADRSNDVMGDNSGRDIGVQISGSFIKLNKWYLIDYMLGVFNGAGINVTPNSNNKSVGGRIVIHPLSWVVIGASTYDGTAYYGVKPENHIHDREGCDLNVNYKNFNLRAEYLWGMDSSSVRRSGYYVQGSYYFFKRTFDALIKYDTYNPNLTKTNNYEDDYTASIGYNFSTYSRLQAAYIFQKEHITQIKNNYAIIRLQIGF